MARNSEIKSSTTAKKLVSFPRFGLFAFMEKLTRIFSFIFYFIWIIIGIFIILVIYSGIKQGAYRNLINPTPQSAQPQVENTAPSEVNIEGVGKVNVACTQNSLSSESIQKLVESKDVNSLSDEEKQKFEECLVKESPEPPNS